MKSIAVLGLVVGALAPVALFAQQGRSMAPIGTLNYVEGQVSVNGNAVGPQQIGHMGVQPNDSLTTVRGKAEVLLSPGIFLRVGDNSELRMLSTDLVDPRIEVVRGEAMIEVDEKLKDARVDVMEHGADVAILKEGLYRFDGSAGNVQVIDGKLQITENGQSRELGRGKEVLLNGAPNLKPVSFDRKAEDDLYVWSNIRSNYLAEANASTAQYVYAGYGPYWGSGWYWNPYFAAYSWLPGDGFFYSPFGYPFFSVGYAPYYGGFRGGFHGGFHGGARAGVSGFRGGAGFAGRGGFAGGHASAMVAHGGGGRR